MINAKIEYTNEETELISQVLACDEFCNKIWGKELLKEVRKKIKDFYKEEQQFKCVYCQNHFPIKHGMGY
jgi:hypothetical protein